MVNKTAVGLLAVVVFASLGVGILVGMQLGGGVDSPTTATSPSDRSTATSTVDGPGQDETGATATATENPTERHTSIPARQFDETKVASAVAAYVNEERQKRNLTTFITGDATAKDVSKMASDHSVAMADYGSAAHEVDGVSTRERYKDDGLFDRCKFKSPEGSYISQPDEEFELIATTYAGTSYEDDGSKRFNGDEQAVARAIVDDWLQNSTYTERLLIRGPTRMGVGVEVTSTGKVFATVDVCA